MTLEEYEAIAGGTVPASQVESVTAQIARTKRILETLLGYTLTPDSGEGEELSQPRVTHIYNETGQTVQSDCSCSDIEIQDLLPPDEVIYAYRLYQYNDKDRYLFVDPFTSLNSVKLVRDGITYKTFDEDDVRADFDNKGIAKYIELCEGCLCELACDKSCVQLAVDADWCFSVLPEDLLQVWADMITFYSDSDWNVRSQTVLGHSYTKANNQPPEEYAYNKKVINNYVGPYGMGARIPTV